MEFIKDAEEVQAQGEIVARAPRGLQDLVIAGIAGMWMIFSGASETSKESYFEQEPQHLALEQRSDRRPFGRRQAWARAGEVNTLRPPSASIHMRIPRIKKLVVIKEQVEVEVMAVPLEEILAAGPLESLATAVEARVTMERSTTIEFSTLRSPGATNFGTPAAAMRTWRNGAVP